VATATMLYKAASSVPHRMVMVVKRAKNESPRSPCQFEFHPNLRLRASRQAPAVGCRVFHVDSQLILVNRIFYNVPNERGGLWLKIAPPMACFSNRSRIV
jgi:hypothetical protein